MLAIDSNYKKVIDRINPKTPKIEALLHRFFNTEVQICPMRSRLATLSWRETEGQPLHVRRAKLFVKICEEIPIAIFDDELIVGSQTIYPRGVGLQLDFSSKLGLEIEAGDRRLRAEQTKGILDDNDLQTIIEDTYYWKGRAPGDVMLQTIKEEMGSIFEDVSTLLCTRSYGTVTLYCPDADYQKVLRLGLRGIIAEIDAELGQLRFESPEDGKKYQFLRAARIALEGSIKLAKRYATLAREMASKEMDAGRKIELQKISEVCEHVPENPPRDFWEALQSVRFIHLCIYMEEGNGSGASLQRPDQYLYPFYRNDLEKGKITRETACELLSAFFVKVASMDSIQVAGIKISGSGYLNTRAILGGVDRAGNDACNELTYLMLHTAGHCGIGLPLYLRWHSGMDKDIMLKAAWVNQRIGSEPGFHNDEQTIVGLVADGASLEDARDYDLHGCAHPYPYGAVYGTYHFVNGGKVFELVMNDGLDPRTGKFLGVRTGDPRAFKSIDDWIVAFEKQWDYMYNILMKGFRLGELVQMQLYSQPFVSALFADCIKNGKSLHEGGSRYLQFTGDFYNKIYADSADSLAAISELVYKKAKLTIDEILEACANSFEGKRGEQIRAMLAAAPKYGNDSGEPEQFYRRLNEHAENNCRSIKGPFGYVKRDTRLAGAVHSSMGRVVGALPSGRKAGTPLADGGISPCAGCDVNGPTVTMRSAAKALDYTTNRSAVLNQKISKALLKTADHMNLFVDLIETFFRDYNGYQIQWNIEDRDTYLAAKATPELYKNLLVRVGGFSAYFVELDPLLQDEIIARTEQVFDRSCCATG